MTDTAGSTPTPKISSLVWLAVGGGVLALAAANAHLVYVATTSQPDCVTHYRHGEGRSAAAYSAATSSCSPTTAQTTTTQTSMPPKMQSKAQPE